MGSSGSSAQCPSDGAFAALIDGRLEPAAVAELNQHVGTCSACATLLEQVRDQASRTSPAPLRPRDDQLVDALLGDGSDLRTQPAYREALLNRGGSIGRYLVLSLLGSGGMGEVYAAYDPDLDRRVALKLLRLSRDTEGARERMLREARALGKLSHPNVVQIYDVGEHAGDVYLAMELVEGRSLDVFCRSIPPPPWQNVLAAYVEAARGLAAAHDQGLVHRDVKPANVLRGNDGHTRLADFGLVGGRPGGPPSSPSLSSATTLPPDSMDDTALAPLGVRSDASGAMTVEGSLLGTPLYMAPEQHRSSHVSPASDQYSLCASLYEGLYGVHPFPMRHAATGAQGMADLLARKLAGVGPPPPGSPVPLWIHQALVRGLAPKPEDRYPSIPELIAKLTDDPLVRRRARRVRWAMAAAAWAVVAVGAAGWIKNGTFRDPCLHTDQELTSIWDPAVKEQIRTAFLGTHRSYAADTATRVEAMLDPYAAEWVHRRGEVCEAQRQSPLRPERFELQDACLDHRLGQLAALTSLLGSKPDPGVLDKAIPTIAELDPLAECQDLELLRARVRPPEGAELRSKVAAIQPEVDRLEVLTSAAKYQDVVAQAGPLAARAKDIGYPEVKAQIDWWLGMARERQGDMEGAKKSLDEASMLAAEAGDHVLVARVWAEVLLILGEQQAKFGEASALRPLGPTLIAEAGDDPRVQREWLSAEGLLLARMGKSAEAKVDAERALAVAEKSLDPLTVATAENNLGRLLREMGDFPAAVAMNEKALAIREKMLGPNHPAVAQSLNNLGSIREQIGEFSAALPMFQRSLLILEGTVGAQHPNYATTLNNLAIARTELGDYAGAVADNEKALAIREKALGPDHPSVSQSLFNLGKMALLMGDPAKAEPLFERSLAISEKSLGPDHPDVGYSLAGLGRTKVRLGALEAAAPLLHRARSLRQKMNENDDDGLDEALLGLSELAVAQKKPREAMSLLAPLLASAPSMQTQEIKLAYADALWAEGSDRSQARTVAEECRAYYERLHHVPGVELTTRWLSEHPLKA